jgi:Zn-dependent peptidase ImmA (M78 family)
LKLWQEYKERGFGASNVLLHLGMLEPPTDPFKIAEALEIIVIQRKFENNKQSGSLIWNQGVPIIWVNKNHHINRKRFTVAHEMGHIFTGTIGASADYDELKHSPDETRANEFAVMLLMPEWQVTAMFMKYGRNTELLASMFMVSEKVMAIRLRMLKL